MTLGWTGVLQIANLPPLRPHGFAGAGCQALGIEAKEHVALRKFFVGDRFEVDQDPDRETPGARWGCCACSNLRLPTCEQFGTWLFTI